MVLLHCKSDNASWNYETHRQHTDAERGLQQARHLSSSDWAPQSAQRCKDTPPPQKATVSGF